MEPTLVYEDNKGAIGLATNEDYYARVKHDDICQPFIRENLARDIIVVQYVSTEDYLADVLTNALWVE